LRRSYLPRHYARQRPATCSHRHLSACRRGDRAARAKPASRVVERRSRSAARASPGPRAGSPVCQWGAAPDGELRLRRCGRAESRSRMPGPGMSDHSAVAVRGVEVGSIGSVNRRPAKCTGSLNPFSSGSEVQGARRGGPAPSARDRAPSSHLPESVLPPPVSCPGRGLSIGAVKDGSGGG
jgi:hypothetical protein